MQSALGGLRDTKEKRIMNGVFPLTLMREACHLSAKGYRSTGVNFRLPPLLINQPAPSFVSCGSRPLVRSVSVSGQNRFPTSSSCYIDDTGGFVYPG